MLVPKYTPKSENQQNYVSSLKNIDNKLLFVVGPAGTGKTLFACTQAIQELQAGSIEKIVITRPIVPVEEDLGFLPGNINKKMDPWVRPIFDIFLENFSQREIDSMVQSGVIEISPLAYMRGRTFKKSFIIADEMQNSTPNQMIMLTTRIGSGSRMVVTGDLRQSDKGMNSGLFDFIEKFRVYKPQFYASLQEKNTSSDKNKSSLLGIKLIELDVKDIERSPIVSRVLDIYSGWKKENTTIECDKKTQITNTLTIKQVKEAPRTDDAALMPMGYISKHADFYLDKILK